MKLTDRLFRSYLDDGEKIVHIGHRHLLIFKLDAVKPFFFGIFVPALLYLLFPKFLLAFVIWGAVGVFGVFYAFVDWYFDVLLLTNIGVIDVERHGLFDVTLTRIEYHMIEGTAYTVKGFWPTILNYGDVTVDKLGAKTSIILKDATRPKRLERKILQCQEQFVYERSIRDHHALKDMLSEMIAYHVHNEKMKSSEKD